MYIIVSKDKRIPQDLKNFEYETWSVEEFIEKATSDEGLSISEDGGIYFNTECLTIDLYEGLKHFSEEILIVYYQFSDQKIDLDFHISEGIINYEVEQPKPAPIVQVEPPKPIVKEPEPVVEPEPAKESESLIKETIEEETDEKEDSKYSMPEGVKVITGKDALNIKSGLDKENINIILQYDDIDTARKTGEKSGKVILFGSAKGGTGKTFTCLISAYRFAKTHPNLKVALADFDIIDGQVGIMISRITPTLKDFYKLQKAGKDSFVYLENCKVKNEKFSSNIDFYLSPPMDIPEITNDTEFWVKVFKLLITNYDVVFFDSGIDYLGKEPISMLYKIADKIIITCNPSINSVKSIVKQFKTLSGERRNSVYQPEDRILDRVYVVLTRVYADNEINNIVVSNIIKYAPVIAAFGNIDSLISKIQWYQYWELLDRNDKINEYLDKIAELDL
jgi:cellulose biosynthesis protein BcsQ